jgi:aspartyl protease family protein
MNRLFFAILGMVALFAFVPDMMVNKTSLSPDAGKDTLSLKQDSQQPTPVEAVSSGSVKLKPGPGGHYVAEFKMNGKSVTALVDTGASSVAINKSTAKRLGIQVSPNDFIYGVSTANGDTKAARAVIREIQIGRVKVRDVEAMVLDDRALNGTLLGMTFLSRLESFSVDEGNLVLKQ